jgi:WXXGXW repeat (2 copies)
MNASRKALLLGLLVAASAGALPSIASAGVAVGIDIDVAPPPVRVEAVPPARVGYVWAPGFWEWRDHAHVWVPGHWIGERRGYHWVPDRWDQRGPHWHHEPGHWER